MTSMDIDFNDSSNNYDYNNNTLKDASLPEVIEKYKCGGVIANKVLHTLIKNCKPGVKIVELCKLGDMMIESECSKVYKNLKVKGQKGISFPTCISPNEIAGHLSPLSNDNRVLELGDLIKIDLGVHIDGFCSVVAHTIVLGQCTGVKANVIAAAWTGAQATLRLLKAHNKNSDITKATTKSANEFNCSPMESVLSHEMKQHVMDCENTIILKETPDRKVQEFEFEHNQVFGIDIMMCSGRGKASDRGEKCTLYKRNVETESPLKMKIARDLLKYINKNHPTFPFTLRNIETQKFRYGITECKKTNLIQPYPVLSCKNNEYVAHFKFTCIISPKGTIQVTGLPLDMSLVQPNCQIKDKQLLNLLETPFNGILPSFYKKPEFTKYNIENENKSNNNKNNNKDINMKNNNRKNNQNKNNRNNNQKNRNRNKTNQNKNKRKNNQNKNKNKNKNKKSNNQNKNKNRNNTQKQAMDLD